METEEQSPAHTFTGSATFLINGQDPFEAGCIRRLVASKAKRDP
jgi:hypothetical protein